MTASRAARPACKGFVIVPKFWRLPLAIDAAMPSALRRRDSSRPSSRPAPAVAPITPRVAVACQPRL
jgi:hypothetical protein